MFTDGLTTKLTLTIGTSSFEVVAGDLKRFELALESWGLSGSAEWWVVRNAADIEDAVFTPFLEKDAITVEFSLKRSFDDVGQEAEAMTFHGLVTEKSVVERTFEEIAGEPVLHRRYTIRFADRGAVLWRQHRPTKIYVDKSLKQLVDDNVPEGVTVEHTWAPSDAVHPVLSLGLGAAKNDASYHDFLFWLLHKENAGLYYDSEEDKYSLLDAKPSEGEATPLEREDVDTIEARFPPVRRDAVSVLNAFSDAATKKSDITNDQGAQGLRTDYLIRSPIAGDLDTRTTLETARAGQREPEAHVTFKVFPAIPFRPSMQVSVSEGWSTAAYQHGKTYRVVSARIAAESLSQEATDDNGETSNRYKIDYTLRLELASDPVFHYPPFKKPFWPFHVEGKVLSETGEETQETYQYYTQDETSLDVYKIKVPLWKDDNGEDLKVIASFEPGFPSGHFYFPIYRDARVLLALEFDRAHIRAFLDWRPGARLPLDAQGNHILVGKAAKDQTSIRHVYEDAKPSLTIHRLLEKDQQIIKISEGTIRIETSETE